MRKGRDEGEKNREKKKRLIKIVATTSLPAVDCPNADRWNAVRLYQKNSENSGPLSYCQSTAWMGTDWNADHLCQYVPVVHHFLTQVQVLVDHYWHNTISTICLLSRNLSVLVTYTIISQPPLHTQYYVIFHKLNTLIWPDQYHKTDQS